MNPHMFRHSRATHLACHLTEAQMKEYFGWVQASRMAAIYVHLSGRDVDHALLKLHGIKTDKGDQQPDQLESKPCSRCKTINPCTGRYCSLCGLPLDDKTESHELQKDFDRQKASAILDQMLEDPGFLERFTERLKATKREM